MDIPPLKIILQDGRTPVKIKQYPIPLEAKRGLHPLIRELLEDGTLETCQSPYNTPILPISKPDGPYRLVQDLCEVWKPCFY